ncbi:DNA excision repair protein ERCC-1-like [Citrus sinensis]|uniref:DNA excision repair protein ERCC-1-like n=1 Tax=Citrus sinensis TaxID=2711 RepID=UPI0022785680|nr:DNA excision repair protein ERCC-1-like [Citrus sinensis]
MSQVIFLSSLDRCNPLLKHIRNVRWAFADVVCDYLLGQNSCALYLRFELLNKVILVILFKHDENILVLYISHPIVKLPMKITCYVVCRFQLVLEDVVKPLLEVTKTALLHDCTLLCAWSLEECGRYLETIKVYENKPADLIQGQMDTDYLSRLTHALTSVRSVNKTDVVTLGSTFGSLSHIMDASMEDLARCPGIGERKVKRLYDTFHEPFKRVVSSHPPIPETPSQKDVERSSVNEVTDVEKDTEDINKRRKKEPELTVKSALSTAFAKYADKIGKKKNSSSQVGETSVSDSGAKNSNSGKRDS